MIRSFWQAWSSVWAGAAGCQLRRAAAAAVAAAAAPRAARLLAARGLTAAGRGFFFATFGRRAIARQRQRPDQLILPHRVPAGDSLVLGQLGQIVFYCSP